MAHYNGRNGKAGGRQVEDVLAQGRVEEALRETNPARTESHGMGFEHEILRRQRTVLECPPCGLPCADQDQRRRAIKDVEVRIAQHRVQVVTLVAHLGSSGAYAASLRRISESIPP